MTAAAARTPSLDDAAEAPTATPRAGASRKQRVLAALVALALIGGGTYWWLHRGLESTDDAQVDADIVALQTRYAGAVVEVRFHENQHVRRGDVLVVLDDAQARAKLAQAEARLAAAEAQARVEEASASVSETDAVENRSIALASLQSEAANATGTREQIAEAEAEVRSAQASLDRATTDRTRQLSLFESGAISPAERDQADTSFRLAQASLEAANARLSALRTNVSAARGRVAEASARARQADAVSVRIEEARARAAEARANVDVARAERDLARLDLEYTRIVAPSDGIVSKKTVAIGQVLSLGSAVAQLVPEDRWVTANFKETQVGSMRPGQHATFTVDAFPGRRFQGTIESVSGATGSRFTLLPPDNASGNFTKVVQRLSVRIHVDGTSGVALRPGMSVEVSIDTRGGRG